MLQAIRDRAMGVLGWVVIGLIIITFALFGLGSYLQDQSRVYAARVNDVEITPQELQLAYQNQRARMQQLLGDAYNPALIDDKALKESALEGLINRQLLVQAAEANGMKISDQLLAAKIQAAAAFQKDGSFDPERYQNLLQQQGQTTAGFEYETRRMLTAEQLANGLTHSAFVTKAEVNRAYSLQEQVRSFDYINVSAEPFIASLEVADADIQAYYDTHGDEFTTPERVRLAYVRLQGDTLASGIEVDDSAVQAAYEQKKESLKTQEQRRASHILFQVPADADDATVEKVRAQAESVLKQLRDGADFAALAKKYSADPASAEQDGDLGFFARGAMVPEFESTVFAMQPGELSELVRTQFGFHIIRLTDITASEIPPLDDVRDELLADLKQHEVTELFYEQLEQLTDLSYEQPDSLEAAADELGLKIETSDWITADGGPGIGEYPQVRTAAFSEDVLEAGNNSEPLEVATNDVLVVRIAEREAAHPTPLEEVKDSIRNKLLQQKAAQAARQQGEVLVGKLKAGDAIEDLVTEDYLSLHQAPNVRRREAGQAPEVLAKVFRMPRPGENAAVIQGFAMDNGDYTVIKLSSVTDGNPEQMTDEQRTQLSDGFKKMRESLVVSTLVEDLGKRANIDIPRDQDSP